MSDYDKLIKLLELLEFEYHEAQRYFEYSKKINKYKYVFTFYDTFNENTDEIHVKVFLDIESNKWEIMYNNYNTIKFISDVLNKEFKHDIRNIKINKLLNESNTKA